MMDKTYESAAEAVADIWDGASLAVGGFGLCGNPMALIEAILWRRARRTCRSSRTIAGWTTGGSESCLLDAGFAR